MKNLITFITLLASCTCMAQDASFKPLRYDENYNFLAKDTTVDWYHRLKFDPLNRSKTTYLSFGGEARYQYFHFKNQDWGEAPVDNDGFVLSRFLAHADLHAGRHFHTFVQLQGSLADGQLDTPSPVDQNPLDLHQAFADYSTLLNTARLTFRVGRQELSYGSQRLVAVRELPNNRQSFDAAKVMYANKDIKLDIFYSNYVLAKPGVFDDSFNKSTRLWGIYTVFNHVPIIQNVDIYYLGLYKRSSTFDEGKGAERRHSLGARLWNSTTPLQYDIEGVYQFGDFAESDISAWTLSANLSYTFKQTRFEPQIGIKTEAISGDKNHGDGVLNTFNPLFPKGAYFGLAALIGPYNLLDAHPYVQLKLAKRLDLAIDYDLFWRMNRNDGLYAVNGRLLYPSTAGTSKQIGRQLGGELSYLVSKYLSFRQELTWFHSGDFLKQAGPGKDILMTGSTVTLRF
ncbi:alginate export family protein [Mucilaginibacter lutimaris]|uniref:Alginate export family protein n=1 Tax=Mucilaginibacter lutimaris TaxID=931629 RepID=A0ABW2ZL31_9SPHI